MEDISPHQPCCHCGRTGDNWYWRLGESFPTPSYEILCGPCCRRQDAEFTGENAVLFAIIIIGVRHGVLNRAVAK